MAKFHRKQVECLCSENIFEMYYLRNFIIAGSKLELVNYLKQRDKEFLMKYLKEITPLQQWLVRQKMSRSILTNEDDGRSIISTVKGFEVTKECFRQLGLNSSLKEIVMDAIAALFQLRDDRISDSHHSVNSNRNGYRVRKRSLYLSASFWRVILEGTKSVDHLKEEYFFGADWKVEDLSLHISEQF